MKGKRLLFFAMAACLANFANAQFSSSEKVYCYEYQYTTEDGIKSQDNEGRVLFVNFQNSMIGLVAATKTEVASKGVSYFENEARNNLAKNYREFNSNPTNSDSQADIYIYDNANSTNSNYTYRRKTKFATVNVNYNLYSVYTAWNQEFWNGNCYTFSSDRNNLVVWYLSIPQSKFNFSYGPTPNYTSLRYYYKVIDANKLKPNVDDLW